MIAPQDTPDWSQAPEETGAPITFSTLRHSGVFLINRKFKLGKDRSVFSWILKKHKKMSSNLALDKFVGGKILHKNSVAETKSGFSCQFYSAWPWTQVIRHQTKSWPKVENCMHCPLHRAPVYVLHVCGREGGDIGNFHFLGRILCLVTTNIKQV